VFCHPSLMFWRRAVCWCRWRGRPSCSSSVGGHRLVAVVVGVPLVVVGYCAVRIVLVTCKEVVSGGKIRNNKHERKKKKREGLRRPFPSMVSPRCLSLTLSMVFSSFRPFLSLHLSPRRVFGSCILVCLPCHYILDH
jgi:hypothetical protein